MVVSASPPDGAGSSDQYEIGEYVLIDGIAYSPVAAANQSLSCKIGTTSSTRRYQVRCDARSRLSSKVNFSFPANFKTPGTPDACTSISYPVQRDRDLSLRSTVGWHVIGPLFAPLVIANSLQRSRVPMLGFCRTNDDVIFQVT